MSYSTSDVTSTSLPLSSEILSDLRIRLSSEPDKQRLQILHHLQALGAEGLSILMDFMKEQLAQPSRTISFIDGKAYQILLSADTEQTRDFLRTHYPQGIVPLQSERSIDYAPLQESLAQQDFQRADQLTLQKLCELAGSTAMQRNWLYFTEVDRFPATDLHTLDTLWVVYSEGRFGFSVQRKLWFGVGQDWDKFWPKIGWKSGNTWTRYPTGFTWDLSAPIGHLPLSNQLRGVRVISSLLTHPAWDV